MTTLPPHHVMTGPEHYRAAEELLRSVKDRDADDPTLPHDLAKAQVHATLAQTAATWDR